MKGMCARGAFEVDVNWNGGMLTGAEVLSKKGRTLAIRYGDINKSYQTKVDQVLKLNDRLECTNCDAASIKGREINKKRKVLITSRSLIIDGEGEHTVDISDVNGRVIFSRTNRDTVTYDLNFLKQGIYILAVSHSGNTDRSRTVTS